MERITSRRNPIVRQFRAAADHLDGRLLLEGAHLLEEALAAGLEIEVVAAGDRATDDLVRRAAQRGARILSVAGSVLAAISPAHQPSGVVALARRAPASLDDVLAVRPQLVLILAGIQDPGNVGAIVRVADACGATGIITSEGTADPFQWKALRGAMGSSFRLPVATRQPLAQVAAAARAHGIQLLATVPRGGTPLRRCNLRRAVAILLGSEGAGLARAFIETADERLTIPMRPPVESLNVATAAALVAYEAQRQREEMTP